MKLSDVLSSDEALPGDALLERETLQRVIDIIKGMRDPDAMQIVSMRLKHRRQADIAAALGCTQSCVCRKMKRIYGKLKEDLL